MKKEFLLALVALLVVLTLFGLENANSYEPIAHLGRKGLIARVGEVPAVRSYLDNIAWELDQMRITTTPIKMVRLQFNSIDFSQFSTASQSSISISDYLSKQKSAPTLFPPPHIFNP